jgi:hypothetical protein
MSLDIGSIEKKESLMVKIYGEISDKSNKFLGLAANGTCFGAPRSVCADRTRRQTCQALELSPTALSEIK